MRADVILPLLTRTRRRGVLTYAVPSGMVVKVGCRVVVEVVTRRYVGLVEAVAHDERLTVGDEEISTSDLKPILEVVDKEPLVGKETLEWYRWVADYYACGIGEVYVAAVPAALRKQSSRSVRRTGGLQIRLSNERQVAEKQSMPDLTGRQRAAYEEVKEGWRTRNTVLLHGVTGSGKTAIYAHVITEAVKDGGQALLLVPEIALTTHLTGRLRQWLGDGLLVYHSKMTDKERKEVFEAVRGNARCVVMGVRSSVLLPFTDLRMVVVDEEHDQSYKQEEPAPRYQARDMAVALGERTGAHVLLGSATPSVESMYNVKRGKYGLARLDERYGKVALPEVEVVDMRQEVKRKTLEGLFSMRLVEEMAETLAHGEQVILFQNRRGYAPYMQCPDCGYTPRCGKCDVSLSLHKRQGVLTCHYCGSNYEVPDVCPQCGSKRFKPVGFGTERVEEGLRKLFPSARIARLDSDSTQSQRETEKILKDFEAHEVDVLVGTQMVTKGLDMRDAHLVGVLNADNLLSYPNYRSTERAFDLLLQAIGRVGRHGGRGKVILQTFSPELDVIRLITSSDCQSMYEKELEERRIFRFPPFVRLIDILIRHSDMDVCFHAASTLATELRKEYGENVLGPDNPPVSRIGRQYARKVTLKIEREGNLRKAKQYVLGVAERLEELPYARGLRVTIDVDPD